MKTALYPEPRRRELFPFVAHGIHLAAAAEPPLPEPSYQAMRRFLDAYRLRGGLDFGAWLAEMDACRAALARLIGAPDPDSIALVKNTATAARCLAYTLGLGPGDAVLTNDREFPSNVWPWEDAARAGGATVVRLAGEGWRTPARLVELPGGGAPRDPVPRAVAWSWVQYRDGYRTDLAELVRIGRARGMKVAVDGIQGLGAIPFSLAAWPVDALYASGHKWLLGPGGAGFLYVAPGRWGDLTRFGRGWLSAERPFAMDLDAPARPGPRAFEDGTTAVASIYGLRASIELLLTVGVDEIQGHVLHLLDHLVKRVEAKGYVPLSSLVRAERGPLLAFRCPRGTAQDLVDELARRDIHVTARDGGLRVAPHVYNTIEEMDALADALP